MPKALQLTGQKFGRLTVENENPIRSLDGQIRWNCSCDCGNRTTVVGNCLTNGKTRSCGCYKRDKTREMGRLNTTHGMSYTTEYKIWNGMIQRCTSPNTTGYSDYGGRGITVCDRWLNSFEAFYEDMGPRPSLDYSIERRENDGNYEKNNCYWATREEQQNNTRVNVFHVYRGNQYTISQLAELPEAIENGVCEMTLYNRIKQYGYSVEKAINTPAREATVTHTHNGTTKTITEWARMYRINYHTLYRRLTRDKWDFERAILTP